MNQLLLAALVAVVLVGCPSVSERREPPLASKPAPAVSGAQPVHRRVLGGSKAGAQTVVLVHGGPGLSCDYMIRLAEQLASPTVRVVLYDQRGAGHSPDVPLSDQTMTGQLADLEALRSDLGAKQLVVMGHSWGGIVAMAYAGAYPDRVSKLVLVDTLPPTVEGNVLAQRRFGDRLVQLQAAGILPAKVEATTTSACERRLLEIMPAYFHDVHHPDTKHMGGASCNNAVLRATWANLGMFDLRPALRQVKARTWVVAGASDPFGFAASEETAAALAHVAPTLRSLQACGHIPWEECPASFYAVLAEVLARD